MIDECMIWHQKTPSQTVLEAVLEGAQSYLALHERLPNFVNLPPGRLSNAERTILQEYFTVAENAPEKYQTDIWLGVMTPPSQSTGAN